MPSRATPQQRAARAREISRNSERLRRQLGKAESPQHQRERYAADPEPRRAAMRAYYSGNSEAVKARVAAHYQANREDILARRRKAYAAKRQATAHDDVAAATDSLSVVKTRYRPAKPTRLRVGSQLPAGYYAEADPIELNCPACTLEWRDGGWRHDRACILR
jgi:hypothetical protein